MASTCRPAFSSISARVTAGAAVLTAAPFLWAYSGGPPPGRAGVPGELTCASQGCHRGPLPQPEGLALRVERGSAGQPYRVEVEIRDRNAIHGFQAAVRSLDDSRVGVGSFRPSAAQRVICSSRDLAEESARPETGCPPARPLEYAIHLRPFDEDRFTIEWAPPARFRDPVVLYLAVNSANADGSFGGDRIHTSSITIWPPGLRTSFRGDLK
jgi:hypothetical protein